MAQSRPDFGPSYPSSRIRFLQLALCLVLATAGCSASGWVKVRSRPDLPLAGELELFSWTGPKPTARTKQWVRRHDLEDVLEAAPVRAVAEAERIASHYSSAEAVYAVAEMAFVAGRWAERHHQLGQALDMYGLSVAYAYGYLFDPRWDGEVQAYDPLFRQACDVYNAALESAMRIVDSRGQLRPGTTHRISTDTQELSVHIACRGPWTADEIAQLRFVSDYEVRGLANHYRSYGLGVPLIARYRTTGRTPAEHYYAPGMSIPVTAFLRVLTEHASDAGSATTYRHCSLELYDPLSQDRVPVAGHWVPLETDLSTPLAYTLNDPNLQKVNVPTLGLISPYRTQAVQGLYMLEPYDPQKIPVLMVHGFWSSLITWMEMFNDLRGHPEIRRHYQFWFYYYPTGQPFWLTAAQLRGELTELRRSLDPGHRNVTLDQMVLVGHSMGGLIARLQTLESGDAFWKLVTDRPIESLDVPDDVQAKLESVFYFHANPSIQRVVMIATPHRGSRFSNGATQWLGHKLIQLPDLMVATTMDLLGNNQEVIRSSPLLQIRNSIDALAPDSPVLATMLEAYPAGWVKYHNVLGLVEDKHIWSRFARQSDGIVRLESARLDTADSQIIVPSDHMTVHRHPRTVLEVQRILLEHLRDVGRDRLERLPPGLEEGWGEGVRG